MRSAVTEPSSGTTLDYMTASVPASQSWRNNRILVGLLFLIALLLWLAAVALGLAAIAEFMPFHFSAIGRILMFILTSVSVGGGAGWSWRAARILGKNEARFEPDGMRIRLYSSARRYSAFCLTWARVASV